MKNIYAKYLLLVIVLVTGCSTVRKPQIPEYGDGRYVDGRYVDVEQYTKKKMADFVDSGSAQALSISLVDNDHIVYAGGFGFIDKAQNMKATADTLYRTASLSKTFTSVAMMKLVSEKRVNVDLPINRYLPHFRFKYYPWGNHKSVTIREILKHEAGIPNIESTYELSANELSYDEVLYALRGEYLTAPVGTIYNYSNLGIALLGGVVERVAQMPYKNYMQQNILTPLGMNRSKFTHIFDQDRGRYQEVALPTMGLVSNVIDLSKFIIMMNQHGKVGNKTILPKSSIEEMLKTQNATATLDIDRKVGLGVDIDYHTLGKASPIYWKTGVLEESRACIAFIPSLKIGIAVLAKSSDNIKRIKALAYDVIIKLWEQKSGRHYTHKNKSVLDTYPYSMEGSYNLNLFGAVEVSKGNGSCNYTITQIATGEPLQIESSGDNAYRIMHNIFDLFSTNIFQGKKFYFTRIDHHETIVMEDGYGDREIVGFKVKKVNLSNAWKETLGAYKSKSNAVDISYQLKYRNGHLLLVWKHKGKSIFAEFLRPVNNKEAIVDNLTAKKRITLRRGVDREGRIFIEYMGHTFYKVKDRE